MENYLQAILHFEIADKHTTTSEQVRDNAKMAMVLDALIDLME